MVNLIPKSVEKIWEIWDIRGAILFSFFVQVFLFFCAPLRKRSNSMLVGWCIWSAYLLADWAANYSVGLITSDTSINDSSSKGDLMAFWTPFLLLHLGGPDVITAFALEDNQLWLRQIPTFFFQLGASIYVFITTLPENTLWIPTLLIFIAGIIESTQRVRALYLASINNGRFLFSDTFNMLMNNFYQFYFQDPLSESKANEILRMIELSLECVYEWSYTKALVLHKKVGFLLRFVTFGSIVVALGVFTSIKKNGPDKFDEIDVIITYTLLYGAVCLNVISFLNLVFSDWIISRCFPIEFPVGKSTDLLKFYEANVVKRVLRLRRQRWSKCKEKPYTKFQALSTPLFFRKWCGSIPRHNLIRCCLSHPRNQVLKGAFTALYKFADCFGVRELLDMSLYKANGSFLLELWELIFSELFHNELDDMLRLSSILGPGFDRADLNEELRDKLLSDFSLERLALNEESMGGFSYDSVIPRYFSKFITIWHVATDLCYAADELNACKGEDERHFSKLLSDYMLYLLIMQPNMLFDVAHRNHARDIFIDTCDQAIDFFRDHEEDFYHNKKEKKETVACRCLLTVPRDFAFSSGHAYSVLSEACNLAKDLQPVQDKKWEVIVMVWVQLLIAATSISQASSHIQQLSKGGELISFVWAFYVARNAKRRH